MCHRNVCWKGSPLCWEGFLILYYGISVSGFARKNCRTTSWADNPVFYYHFWSVIRSIMILKVEKYGMELDTRRIWRYGLCQRFEQLWIAVREPSRSWYVPSFSGRTLFWKKAPFFMLRFLLKRARFISVPAAFPAAFSLFRILPIPLIRRTHLRQIPVPALRGSGLSGCWCHRRHCGYPQ